MKKHIVKRKNNNYIGSAYRYRGISLKRTLLVQKIYPSYRGVCFIEILLLEFDLKSVRSVPRYSVRYIEMSALGHVRFRDIPGIQNLDLHAVYHVW